jgi:large subunit ribosomal protein L35
MPKQKSHKAAGKRFKVTGAGKLLRKRAMANHLLGKKSSKRKRGLRRPQGVDSPDLRSVRRLLGRR